MSNRKPNKICDGVPTKWTIVLYLGDAYGVEVPGTACPVELTILKEADKATIQISAINFLTGPFANNPYELNNPASEIIDGVPGLFLPPPQNGGYLFTKSGYLPKSIRPNELLNLSYFAASNNGMNQTFVYIPNGATGATGPEPAVSSIESGPVQPGYVLQVTSEGALIIQGMGTIGNIIPPGAQSLMPTTISYIIKPKIKLCKNVRISKGEINTAVFPFSPTADPAAITAAQLGLRDLHVNDVFENVVAFAWADNSNVKDQASNFLTMNLAVAIGKVKDGQLKMKKPIFIPTPTDHYVWDTAIAINRQDKKNIMVSWLSIDINAPQNGQALSKTYRAVSKDGGKTWPINGQTEPQPTGEFIVPGFPVVPGGAGDGRGLSSDKYGNFWYLSSNLITNVDNLSFVTNAPFIMISTDGGETFKLIFTFPIISLGDLYDFGQLCFGGDGLDNYGVYICADYFPNAANEFNGYPTIAFIPIFGLGSYGTAKFVYLEEELNTNFTASLTASADGRFWRYGNPPGLGPAAYPYPGSAYTNNNTRITYKSPGDLCSNYVDTWSVMNLNALSDSLDLPIWSSQPVFGMFQAIQTNLYDDQRQALYVCMNTRTSDGPANSKIYFQISRNNGQTWSAPLEISNTSLNNRGFQSMALDVSTGNLVIGWYDGRDYKNQTGLNYYGAVIEAKFLDALVAQIPCSNPVYQVSSPMCQSRRLHTPSDFPEPGGFGVNSLKLQELEKIPTRHGARIKHILRNNH